MLESTERKSLTILKSYGIARNGMNKSSFRDPSGYIFYKDDVLYRCINPVYKANYDEFISSGLYATLIENGYIISHTESDLNMFPGLEAYKVIRPREIKFISYPYEWCFSQLKDAALLTLNIQLLALEHGMTLKDASAYNMQFSNGKPIFIDTLSFEKYTEGMVWKPYAQFCRHFLAPLSLMYYKDIRLGQLLETNLDGIPLDLASELLPLKAKLNWFIFTNLVAHSRSQVRYSSNSNKREYKISKLVLKAIIENLKKGILGLNLKKSESFWANYYSMDSYTEKALLSKKAIVQKFIDMVQPKTVWDIGANTGEFSKLAKDSELVLSIDNDIMSVERNYLNNKGTNILPLVIDLTNPSPNIGWDNSERVSISERGKADLLMALAVIHHLAISNNVPLQNIADYLAKNCRILVIEFIPKSDKKVQVLLNSREDIFPNYTKDNFEKVFWEKFNIVEKQQVLDSDRVLYLMVRKGE